MDIKLIARKSLIGMAFVWGVLLSSPVSAATFTSCVGTGYDINNYVSGAADCTVSDDFDNDNPTSVVNELPGFFNITNWLFGGKLGEDAGYEGTGTQIGGNGEIGGEDGTYDFSGAFEATWQNIMLVFKDGGETTLVGYLLESGVLDGDWESPFVLALFPLASGKDTKNVSHISVYYTECTANCAPVETIPLPAGILLLISALGGLGFLARFGKAVGRT